MTIPDRPSRPSRRSVFTTARDSVAFESSMRVMVAMGAPMVLGVMFGRPDLGSLASIGVLAAPVVGPWTYPQRARRLIALALVMGVAFALGAAAAPHPALVVLVIGAWAAGASLAAGLLGSWAAQLATITGVACILGTALHRDQVLPSALTVAVGGLWLAAVFCLGWRPHRWQPDADAVGQAYRAVADYLDALGTPEADARRIEARRAVLNGWDAVGLREPGPRDPDQRWRLYTLLQHAQRLLDAAVWLGLERRAEAGQEELAQAVRALALTVTDPALADLVVVPLAPPGAGRRTVQCGAAVQDARRDAATAVPDPLAAVVPLRETTAHRVHGMRPLRAVQLRTAARLGLAVSGAGLLASAAPLAYGYWVPLTVLIVMRADPAATQVRAVQRALGTVAGVVAAGGLLLVRPTDEVAAIGMCVVAYLLPVAVARSFLLASAARTAFALLLIEAPQPQAFSSALLVERVLDTALGAGVAVLATMLLWPWAATSRLPAAIGSCLTSIAGVLRDVVRSGTPAAGALLPQLLSLRALYDDALGERARPWPSTERLWPAVVCTMRLGAPVRFAVMGTDAQATQPLLTPDACVELADVLDDLAAAVRAGREPRPLPWPPGQGPGALADLVAELHGAVALSCRPPR